MVWGWQEEIKSKHAAETVCVKFNIITSISAFESLTADIIIIIIIIIRVLLLLSHVKNLF